MVKVEKGEGSRGGRRVCRKGEFVVGAIGRERRRMENGSRLEWKRVCFWKEKG